MPLILPTRNPLAYPAGVAPGFDPSHVAGLPIFSAVAIAGGKAMSLVRFTTVSSSEGGGTTSSGIDGGLGPYLTEATANGNLRFLSVQRAVAQPQITFAAILSATSVAGPRNVMQSGDSDADCWALRIIGTSGNLGLTALGVLSIDSGIPVASGDPFFIVGSITTATSNFVAANLRTGSIKSAVAGGATAGGTCTANVRIGQDFSAYLASVKFSAGMFCYRVLSIADQLKWAADPWSFWYPRRQIDRVGITAASFKPYWANRNNDFAIGTGLQ